MSTSSSERRGRFWRSDWFVGAAVVLAVVVPYQATDLIGPLERRFYDDASTVTTGKPSDRIALIAIGDQSIANIGRRPWPRDVHAELIDRLAGAKAKTTVHTAMAAVQAVNPAAPPQPADNGLAGGVPAAALPGYDAAHNHGLAGEAQAGTTPVMNKPGAAERPRAGGDQAGQEP